MAYDESTVTTKLMARRDAILDELAALNSSAAGGKPDSTLTGIQHVAYKKSLYEELGMLNQQIALTGDGPCEVLVEGFA